MGNKNSDQNTGFMQMGYQHSGFHSGCDCGSDMMASVPYPAACTNDSGCDAAYNACDCDCSACGSHPKRNKKHGDKRCDCTPGDETHIFFESCDGAKEICVTSRCQEDEAPGRTLDVNCTLANVCPGRRSALGITLMELDEDGTEYARGFRAITVPAHNGRCNQDVQVDTVRFILPEELSLQERRHFVVRTNHHYLDAASIWNNTWGGGR